MKNVINDGYFEVCNYDNLKELKGEKFTINDVEIAIFKINGEVFAINNICPHQHASILHNGFIEEGCVICPAHGWEFSLTEGKSADGRKLLEVYSVLIIDNIVYVKVTKKKFLW